MKYHLTNWSVVPLRSADVYAEPKSCLRGRRNHGELVRTSQIIKVRGNQVTTASGTVYILGEPDPHYVQWCKDTGAHIPTPKEPIKVI